MIPPDFSTWHAVRSAKPRDLFRILDPEHEFYPCMCHVRGVKGNTAEIDVPFRNGPERRTIEIQHLIKCN